MNVELIAVTQSLVDRIQNQEQLIEYAGRVCYNTQHKTGHNTAQFLKARMKQGHASILEHVNFTFEISGISRSCLAQLTRHRLASYSVQSMRYVKDNKTYIIPKSIENNRFCKMVFDNLIKYCETVYYKLIECGIKPEDARFVLPVATSTQLIMTMNLRELLHFVELRTDKAAQWEIRELGKRIKEIVMGYCPNVI